MIENRTQQPIISQLDPKALASGSAPADRFVYSKYFKPIALSGLPETPDPDSIEVQRTLLASELGHLFLDRTRIRPAGFAVGEHLHSLSLAPGEEVVLEQRTFSKRETTYEEQSEREQSYDLELSSTLSTELSEGLDRERNHSDTSTLGAGGSASGEYKGVTVNADVSYSRTVADANSQASRRSVKDSTSATSKLASKYRAQHKTVFRVATEDRYESTSRRVIRNPNAYTPIDLHYFKILRRLELTQERYGVRLCWAPAIKDPAADVMLRIENGRKDIVDRALAAVEAAQPPAPTPPARTEKPILECVSEVTEADKYGLTGDMSADYKVPIEIPGGYVWNGNLDEVKELTEVWGRKIPREMGWYVKGMPVTQDGKLMVTIHVGAGSWIGGPEIWMQVKARFMADSNATDPAYEEAVRQYQIDLAKWKSEKAAATLEARTAAEKEAEEWAAQVIARLDPVAELMEKIAKTHFAGTLSDEPWEVEFWNHVFDWERAGIAISPSWYAQRPSRDFLQGPYSFMNASWAKLYLPVRPGYERLALRWIVQRVRDGELDPAKEAVFTRLVDELRAFRKEMFGDEVETVTQAALAAEPGGRFLTLAQWAELLPTDGTHAEVVQGMSTALDEHGRLGVEEDRRAQQAKTEGELQDVAMKKKAVEAINGKQPPSVQIRVGTDDLLMVGGAS